MKGTTQFQSVLFKGQLYIEMNENESKKYQNLQEAAKAVLRWKFIALNMYIRKKEKSQINNLSSHLKNLGKEEQNRSKENRRKNIIKIFKINGIENRKTIEKISETKDLIL